MPTREQDKTAIAREGYRQLAEQLRHEEALSWKRLETFLVISSALVALIGLFWPSAQQSPLQSQVLGSRIVLTVLIAVVGLSLSIGWIIVVRRSEAFHDFRYLQLIEAEGSALKPNTAFTNADDYFSGETVSIGRNEYRLKGPPRWVRIYQVMTAVPIVFSLLWAVLLAYFAIAGLPFLPCQKAFP
jgi:hypothetical protein